MTPLRPPVDPARDHGRGPRDAGVTLVQYGDFQCPYCAEAYPQVREALARTGDGVAFVFRHFPLAEKHPHAEGAAQAAEAAAAQGRFWAMHDRLYEAGPRALRAHSGEAAGSAAGLREHARAAGVEDLDRFDAELAAGVHLERVREDVEGGLASGVEGTPAFFLNGKPYRGFYDAETLVEVLRDTLSR
jgi:NhaA family Na+:H+ antiporter